MVPCFIIKFWFMYLKALTLFLYEHHGVDYMQEVGHFLAAFPKKVKLSIPYFIPNITLGSFGAITQVCIYNCPHREILVLEVVKNTSCA